MSDDVLLSHLADGVLTLTLNRPDRRNALNPPLMRALHEALAAAAEDREVRCVLLRGNGKDFCAGGDVSAAKDANESKAPAAEMTEKRAPPTQEQLIAWLRRSAESTRLLHEMGKPTVAAVQGNVIGAGFGLAAACDFRIVADSASFASGYLKVGYSGDFGGAYFATRLLGAAKARELFLLNERMDANTAERLGLATRRVSDDALEQEAADFAGKLAKGPPVALRYMKDNLAAAERERLPAYLDRESVNQNKSSATADSKEAVKALFEKRPPVFKGE